MPQVYAIDLLAFGASAKPIMEYTVELWQDLVVDFLAEFVEGPAVLVGNSLGSLIALAVRLCYVSVLTRDADTTVLASRHYRPSYCLRRRRPLPAGTSEHVWRDVRRVAASLRLPLLAAADQAGLPEQCQRRRA